LGRRWRWRWLRGWLTGGAEQIGGREVGRISTSRTYRMDLWTVLEIMPHRRSCEKWEDRIDLLLSYLPVPAVTPMETWKRKDATNSFGFLSFPTDPAI
jgi:hypothetical protein